MTCRSKCITKEIQGNTWNYKETGGNTSQGNTRKWKAIQGNIRKYKEIQGNGRNWKETQGNSRGLCAAEMGNCQKHSALIGEIHKKTVVGRD